MLWLFVSLLFSKWTEIGKALLFTLRHPPSGPAFLPHNSTHTDTLLLTKCFWIAFDSYGERECEFRNTWFYFYFYFSTQEDTLIVILNSLHVFLSPIHETDITLLEKGEPFNVSSTVPASFKSSFYLHFHWMEEYPEGRLRWGVVIFTITNLIYLTHYLIMFDVELKAS